MSKYNSARGANDQSVAVIGDIRKRLDVKAFVVGFGLIFSLAMFFFLYGEIAVNEGHYIAVAKLAAIALFLILPPRAGLLLTLHEGLHAIIAHWLNVPAHQIAARGNQVFVGKVSFSIWRKVTLAPLLLPLFVFGLWLFFNWRIGLGFAALIALGSVIDLACYLYFLFHPTPFVIDDEDGIRPVEA